jgi:hypothetical protein
MSSFQSPTILDTNIILSFEGNLELLCQYFQQLYIHEYLLKEILTDKVKDELEKVNNKYKNIKYVNDSYINNLTDIDKKIYQAANKELGKTFNLAKNKDIGECKTLLYAKFNNIKIISSQDTTIWPFITYAEHFNNIECMTIMDLGYFIYLSGSSATDRATGKAIYKEYSKAEHKFEYFKIYAERNNNQLPLYIEFENERIFNFLELSSDYIDFIGFQMRSEKIGNILEQVALSNVGTCLDCIYSRLDKHKIALSALKPLDSTANPIYVNRICSKGYTLNNEDCISKRIDFSKAIEPREKD